MAFEAVARVGRVAFEDFAVTPFDGGDVYDVAAEMGVFQGVGFSGGPVTSGLGEAIDKLTRLLAFARSLSLPTSPGLIQGQIDALVEAGREALGSEWRDCGVEGPRFARMVMEINRRIADELRLVQFFYFTPGESALDAEPIVVPASLGEQAVADGIEAVRCYAASRYTAAGFHAMRVAERVVRSLIPKAHLNRRAFYPSIDSILVKIERKLRQEEERRRKQPRQRRRIPLARFKWLTGIVATFRSLTNAWRNPIGHYANCTREEALELINVARSLVRQLTGPS